MNSLINARNTYGENDILHVDELLKIPPDKIEKNEDVICNIMGQKECFQTFDRIMEMNREERA